MKKDTKRTTVIILKGNKDVEGTAIKQNAIEVVLTFVSKVLDVPFTRGNFVQVIKDLDSSKPGDVQWLRENVFRKVDIQGTTCEKESTERAEKLISVFNSLDAPKGAMGWGIVRYYLDQMYMHYDISE